MDPCDKQCDSQHSNHCDNQRDYQPDYQRDYQCDYQRDMSPTVSIPPSYSTELSGSEAQLLGLYADPILPHPRQLYDPYPQTYSQRDIERILYIEKLTRDLSVNLAGVEEISHLQQELEQRKQKMQREIFRLHDQIEQLEHQIGSN